MQITGYKWVNWEPFFNLKDGKDFGRMRLFDENVSINLGKKFCVGFFKDGKHHPCPDNREIRHGWNCDDCRVNDDFFQCIRCSGECINPKKRSECEKNNYYIYLAAFDSLLKVGISYEHRILERLVEQGADFGAKIAFIRDGREARSVEQKIKNNLTIADRILGSEKHKTLFGNPNVATENITKALVSLKEKKFDLIKPEIYDMRRFYRLQNVLSDPENISVCDGISISGRVVAAKGNLLVLRNNGSFFSVNAHDIIGREIQSI
ncbi:MAG: DUF2797 domain-containing protein [Candidatus Aenigmatarchaeota archaeon]